MRVGAMPWKVIMGLGLVLVLSMCVVLVAELIGWGSDTLGGDLTHTGR
jgi:hypothetical protein